MLLTIKLLQTTIGNNSKIQSCYVILLIRSILTLLLFRHISTVGASSTRIQKPCFIYNNSNGVACSELKLSKKSAQLESSIRWINGRRCLFAPSRNVKVRNEVACDVFPSTGDGTSRDSSSSSVLPPIVVLGGMAQSISSWEHHVTILSKDRDVFVYEYLGSGLGFRHPDYQSQLIDGNHHNLISTEDEYYGNVTLSKQAEELAQILVKIFPDCKTFDIIAFSLGARIALATIALFPTVIRKAALTGVGLDRSPFAKVVLHSWKDILSSGVISNEDHASSLKAFAWSIIMTTYSKSFIETNGAKRVASWVEHICENNNHIGLFKLLEQTHTCSNPTLTTSLSPNTNEMLWFVGEIKRHYKNIDNIDLSKNNVTDVQIHIGENDQLSTLEQASELNSLISRDGNSAKGIIIYKDCGHAVMNEDGRTWRKNVMDYLSF